MELKDRINRIAARVATSALTDGQPEDDIFGAAFALLRQKARDFKEKQESETQELLQKNLIKDLKGRGYDVVSVEISLGKYRGSRFVTSAKVRVNAKDARDAKALVKVLQHYHPRYSLKSFEDGVAVYNIR